MSAHVLARFLAPRRRRAVLATGAPPDEALLRAIAVLRSLGARITRYDGEEGLLEARIARWRGTGTVRVLAVPDGSATVVRVESDAAGWGTIRRLLSRELPAVEDRQG